MGQRVLAVEDDEPLGRQVEQTLGAAGFEVFRVRRGDEACEQDLASYALVVLDLMLPGAHGLDVLKAARRSEVQVPVLVLSARSDTVDKVRALELGADDYLPKPFWPEELVARVRARLRRPALDTGEPIQVGDLTIDLAARSVRASGVPVDLTPMEFDLLAALARRAGVAISRAALAAHVRTAETGADDRALDTHVSRLRRKLGRSGRHLATVWGVGYRLTRDA